MADWLKLWHEFHLVVAKDKNGNLNWTATPALGNAQGTGTAHGLLELNVSSGLERYQPVLPPMSISFFTFTGIHLLLRLAALSTPLSQLISVAG